MVAPPEEARKELEEIWKRRMLIRGSTQSPEIPPQVARVLEQIKKMEEEYERKFQRRIGFVL